MKKKKKKEKREKKQKKQPEAKQMPEFGVEDRDPPVQSHGSISPDPGTPLFTSQPPNTQSYDQLSALLGSTTPADVAEHTTGLPVLSSLLLVMPLLRQFVPISIQNSPNNEASITATTLTPSVLLAALVGGGLSPLSPITSAPLLAIHNRMFLLHDDVDDVVGDSRDHKSVFAKLNETAGVVSKPVRLARLARYYAFGYGVCRVDMAKAEALCRQAGVKGRALLGYILWHQGDNCGGQSLLNLSTAKAIAVWCTQPMDAWSALLLCFFYAGNDLVGSDLRFMADTLLTALLKPLQFAAKAGDAWAAVILACSYGWPKGVDKSLADRDRWLKYALDQQCAEAQCHAFWECENVANGRMYLDAATAQGYPLAHFYQADALDKIDATEDDKKRAICYIQFAADAGLHYGFFLFFYFVFLFFCFFVFCFFVFFVQRRPAPQIFSPLHVNEVGLLFRVLFFLDSNQSQPNCPQSHFSFGAIAVPQFFCWSGQPNFKK